MNTDNNVTPIPQPPAAFIPQQPVESQVASDFKSLSGNVQELNGALRTMTRSSDRLESAIAAAAVKTDDSFNDAMRWALPSAIVGGVAGGILTRKIGGGDFNATATGVLKGAAVTTTVTLGVRAWVKKFFSGQPAKK